MGCQGSKSEPDLIVDTYPIPSTISFDTSMRPTTPSMRVSSPSMTAPSMRETNPLKRLETSNTVSAG